MKRILSLGVLAWLGGLATLEAQDASAIADRQAAEERYQQLAGKVQDLAEAQQAQAKRLEALAEEIRSLRGELGRANPDVVQREELRKLAEEVREIDEKRTKDKELILSELAKLGKPSPVTKGKATTKTKPDSSTDSTAGRATEKAYEGFEHSVKSGETLMAIVQAYNKEHGLKLTVEQVLQHPLNAGLKPEKLRIGQTVFIPAK